MGLLVCTMLTGNAHARGTYQDPDAFLAEVFAGEPPPAQAVWLLDERPTRVQAILGHPYEGLRVRYWLEDGRSAWILDEIGKDRPITTGIVVSRGRIEDIRVLVFRESRGWEVRRESFRDQFRGARLDGDDGLDRTIDGITGATLSVRALKRQARLALYLHGLVTGDGPKATP
jgi:hypothetical protein